MSARPTLIISPDFTSAIADPPQECGCGHMAALFLFRGGRTGCSSCMKEAAGNSQYGTDPRPFHRSVLGKRWHRTGACGVECAVEALGSSAAPRFAADDSEVTCPKCLSTPSES